jgi:16S rRNA (guanine527-N7)-methyltransferase
MTADEFARDLSLDPLECADAVRAYLGDRYEAVHAFGAMLADQGVIRGLIGPREMTRIWERHLLNSAAVVPFLGEGAVIDVGSGAGLPGVVIAAMEPHRHVTLVEPMDRRVQWLAEVTETLGLANVEIVRGRAEEVGVMAPLVTARAVAAIDKLVKWCAPLLAPGGRMVLLKGRSAADELERAKYVLRKAGLAGTVAQAQTVAGLEPTTVVTLRPA